VLLATVAAAAVAVAGQRRGAPAPVAARTIAG
jgi:hypothetical protein